MVHFLLQTRKFTCFFTACIAATLLIGCGSGPKIPKESTSQRHFRLLNNATTIQIQLSDSPWEEFDQAFREIVQAFRLQLSTQENSDLLMTADVSGDYSERSYEKQTRIQGQGRRLFPTGKNSKLSVGFNVKGKVQLFHHGERLKQFDLYGNVSGPQFLFYSEIAKIKAQARQKSMEKTLAHLCHELIKLFPGRLPLEFIKNGPPQSRKACFDWLDWPYAQDTRYEILIKLLEDEPSNDLLVRIIDSFQKDDFKSWSSDNHWYLLDNFPAWLANPDSEVQEQAAKKIVELTPHLPADVRRYPHTGRTRYPLTKIRQEMVKRFHWILDAIPKASNPARPILVKGAQPNLTGEISSADFGGRSWHTWCELDRRIEHMQQTALQDPLAEIRSAVLYANSEKNKCDLAQTDPSPDVREKALELIYKPKSSHGPDGHNAMCTCKGDMVDCLAQGYPIRKGLSTKQLENTARHYMSIKDRVLKHGNETERRKYMRSLVSLQRLLGTDHNLFVQETGGPRENYFEYRYQRIRQHCDKQVRKLALEELPATPGQLSALVKREPDPALRKIALKILLSMIKKPAAN